MRIVGALAVATGLGIGIWQGGVIGGGPPATANVFIAPPSTAGLGTSGSDADVTNCARFSTAVTTPPSGVGFGCATFQKAYTLANPGDKVFLNWNGAWQPTGEMKIGTSGNKTPGSGACNEATGDLTACIHFLPGPGLTASFITAPVLTHANNGDTGGATLHICADYIEMSGFTMALSTFVDSLNNVFSEPSIAVGTNDNSCRPGGGTAPSATAPPHDIYLHNLILNGQGFNSGGAYNVYWKNVTVQNVVTAVGFTVEGASAVSGVNDPMTHNDVFDGFKVTGLTNDFAGGITLQHQVCFKSYSGATNITVENSYFVQCSPAGGTPGTRNPYATLRVSSEGVFCSETNWTIQNNYFDSNNNQGDLYLNAGNCNNATLTGFVVRFNTFAGNPASMPNLIEVFSDCSPVHTGCNTSNNVFYGNLIKGGCPSISTVGHVTEDHNVFTNAAGGICTGDATSIFSATVTLTSPGSPTFDDSLTGCSQAAVGAFPVSAFPSVPATDINGLPFPNPAHSTTVDAGASQAC